MTMIKRLFGGRKDVDMTEGSILRHIIMFAFPLLLGNIFQQMYNMVDVWVVGNFVSDEAFSAVGTVGPIINFLVSFFSGFSAGTGVIVSQYYGAKKQEELKRTVHTAVAATFIIGVVITAVGILLTPTMLRLINTPDEVFDESRTYLTVYFSGILGLMVYNIGAAIMRSVGDSQRPFYFLVFCALTNIVLDLVFVLACGMGVEGVALATIVSQGLSAVLVMITLVRSHGCIKVYIRKLRVHADIFLHILKLGLPIGLRFGITAFSNVFVQSYINHFGKYAMGGWTAYSKIDQLILLPMQAVSIASTTFVGQNLGAEKVERAKKGITVSVTTAAIATVILIIPTMIFAPTLVEFFNDDPQIVEFGTTFLRWMTPFYVLCCTNQIYAGALNGAGKTMASTVIMLSSFVAFRQLYLFVMATFISNTIIPIAMSYPAGWIVCSLLMFIYYRRVDLSKSKIVK